jgi:hypothetical protein
LLVLGSAASLATNVAVAEPSQVCRIIAASQALQNRWETALDQRAALSPHSPVPLLDALLTERAHKIVSQTSPNAPDNEQEPGLSAEKPGSDLLKPGGGLLGLTRTQNSRSAHWKR